MKTIVARFTEMKKAPTGIVDVEGEEVNVNKVEAALKSVGVQLRDTTGQFRDLDDVFLELSSKWDSLDKMSQRYVATTAAGSRQQSRFIAMMSNYQRTMELTGYATNSAGASQKQFEKTMDSLESKLNRLHDAWEQYVTGMANQSAIKGVVDLLTNLISGLNKFTDAIDPARTGWSKLLVTILGFKAAKGIINGVVKNLGAQLAIGMGKKGAEVGTSFSKTFINKIKNIKVGVVGSQSTKEAALANKELAAAQQEAKIASEQLANAQAHQALTEKQAMAAAEVGTVAEKHDIAIKNAKIGVQTAEANVTEANNKVKEKEIAVNELVANSENRLQRVHSLSILQRLNLARIMVFGSTEKKKQILINYGLATSEEAEAIATGSATAAQTAFNIALEACPIMWIITAVAALVAGLAILAYTLSNQQTESQKLAEEQEKLGEALQDATSKADEAKEAYDNLLENRNTYNSLYDEIQKMTIGTELFNQKALEAKEIVNDLLEKYPELNDYVETVNGVRLLSKTGYQKAVELSSQSVDTAEMIKDAVDYFEAQIEMEANKATRKEELNKSIGSVSDNVFGFKAFTATSLGKSLDLPKIYRFQKQENDWVNTQEKMERYDIYKEIYDIFAKNPTAVVKTDEKDKEARAYTIKGQTEYFKIDSTQLSLEEQARLNEYLYSMEQAYETKARNGGFHGRFKDSAEAKESAQYDWNILLGTALHDADLSRNDFKQLFGKISTEITERLTKQGRSDDFITDYTNYIMSKGISDNNKEYSDKFDTYISGEYEKNNEEILKKLANRYKEITGIEYNIEDIDDNEDSIKEAKEKIARQLAAYETFQKTVDEQVSSVSENINKYGTQYHDYLKVVTGNTKNMSAELAEALITQKSVTEYFKNAPELQDKIAWNNITATVQKNIKNLAGFFDTTEEHIKEIAKKDYKLLNNYASLFSGWSESTGLSFDFSGVNLEELDEDTYNTLSEVDWSKPIQALEKINSLTKQNNENLNNFVGNIKQSAGALLSTKKQIQQIFSEIDSSTWEDLSKDLQITTDELNNLKEEMPIVGTMLDETGISANTLADYLTKVAKGEMSIISTSNNFISALDKAKSAMNNIKEAIDFTENFSTATSSTTIDDNFTDFREKVDQALERGQYGDPALLDYTKMILGNENFENYYSEFNGNLQKIEELAQNKIDSFGDNFYGFWTQFAQISDMVSQASDGSITFDFSQFSSIEELSKELQDKMKVSEDFAKSAIASAQTYSSNLTNALNKLSFSDAVNELVNGAFKTNKNGKTTFHISEEELQFLADEAGLTEEELAEVRKKISDQLSAQHYEVKFSSDSIITDTGGLSEEIIKNLATSFKDAIEKGEGADLSGLFRELLEQGFSEEEAKAQIESILKVVSKELGDNPLKPGEVFVLDKNGKLIKSANKTGKLYYDSIQGAISSGILDGVQSDVAQAAAEYEKAVQEQATFEATALGITAGVNYAFGQWDNIDLSVLRSKIATEAEAGFSTGIQEAAKKLQEVKLKANTKATFENIDFGFNLNQANSYNNTNAQGAGGPGGSYDSKDKENTTEEKKDEWINDWDRQTDILKKIENLERERNKLAKEQERYLKKNILREHEVFNIKEKQRKNIMQQMRLNEQLAKDAESWLRGMNSDGNFDGAIWWDESSKRVRTNDAYIRSMDEDTKKEFDKVRSDYEHYENQFNTANDNMSSLTDTLEDLTETVVELDYHNNTERLIEVIERTIDLYDKAAKRLEWTEKQVSSQKVLELYDAKSKEFIAQFNASTDDFIQTESEINAMLNKQNYKKYYTYDWKTGKVTTTGAYDAITDKDYKNQVADFVNKLANLFKQRSEDESKRIDVQEQQRAADRELIDKAESFGKNVYDAIINQREKEISELENINTSIQNAASELVSSIQKNIQKIRQDRTNKKTEEELYKMQSKLDFLRVDTSTGNQKAILDLEKQLDDKQQSYTDSLIDQKINELQDQNKEAEKQRKEQIDIMKAQLDYDKDNGIIWRDVRYLIANGLAKNGNIVAGSDLDTALKQWGKYNSLSTQGQKDWMHEQNLGGSYYNAYNFSGGNQRNYAGQYTYGVSSEQLKTLQQNSVEAYKQGLIQSVNKTTPYKDYMYYDANSNVLKQTKLFPNEKQNKTLHDLLQATWKQVWDTINTINSINAYYNKNSANNIVFTQVPSIARFASGGLADFTGPAWLDGTKTSPEMVLNARDTENFIQLKNILGNIMDSGVTSTNNGDFYFEIKIDVDKMNSDYDVDQVVNRIKQQIINEARYRNVNTINMIR